MSSDNWGEQIEPRPVHSGEPSRVGIPLPGADQTNIWSLQFIEMVVQRVVLAITGVLLPGPIGSAVSQLATWVSSTLPALILAPFQALVTALINLLGFIPGAGPALDQLVELFGFMQDTTAEAQQSADTANAGVAALKAGASTGTAVIDTFDRIAAVDLGADWDQTYESGSGTLGVDGEGNAFWDTAGSNERVCLCRYAATALTDDRQVAQFVLTEKLVSKVIDPRMSLNLRMNAANDTYVEAQINYNSCQFVIWVSGTDTLLGSPVAITSKAGDLWEFRAGRQDGTEDYEFTLLQNGVSRLTEIDPDIYTVTVLAIVGNYHLEVNGNSAAVAFNANAATVKTALETADPTVTATVTGTAPNFTVTLSDSGVLTTGNILEATVANGGPLSQLGASYRYGGMTVKAGATLVGFVPFQYKPPDVQIFTATDNTP